MQFSVDDFEAADVTAWEGVRNHEAKNIMKSMKVGDKVCMTTHCDVVWSLKVLSGVVLSFKL